MCILIAYYTVVFSWLLMGKPKYCLYLTYKAAKWPFGFEFLCVCWLKLKFLNSYSKLLVSFFVFSSRALDKNLNVLEKDTTISHAHIAWTLLPVQCACFSLRELSCCLCLGSWVWCLHYSGRIFEHLKSGHGNEEAGTVWICTVYWRPFRQRPWTLSSGKYQGEISFFHEAKLNNNNNNNKSSKRLISLCKFRSGNFQKYKKPDQYHFFKLPNLGEAVEFLFFPFFWRRT